ncbi:hypothetical protein BH11ARM2_BH11ARM2_31910 [soil metagenome]
MGRATATKDALEWAERHFGGPFDKESLARLIAAPSGSAVTASIEFGNLSVKASHKGLDLVMERTFRPNGTVHHDLFRAEKAPKGTGARIFARQVANYVDLGLTSIDTLAAGNLGTLGLKPPRNWNGYLTWPKFGYNATLTPKLQSAAKTAGFEADDLHALSLKHGDRGMEWWKNNGGTPHMVFDLTDGSPHREILDAYIQKRLRA